MKTVRILIILLCLAAIAVGSWNIFHIQSGYHQGAQAYAQLDAYTTPPETEPEPVTDVPAEPAETEDTRPTEPTEPEIPFPEVDFAALREINSSVVGWISLEDTDLSYPIAQAKDNKYYLEHLFSGEANSSGCIFLDCSNWGDFSDRNNILYGHNMRNGAMFAPLLRYKDPAFYEEHPRLLLITPERNYVVEIFSGYVLSGWGNAWVTSFGSDGEYEAWLAECAGRSCFSTGITPEAGDRILTLSTCTYEYDDARFLIQGILREIG